MESKDRITSTQVFAPQGRLVKIIKSNQIDQVDFHYVEIFLRSHQLYPQLSYKFAQFPKFCSLGLLLCGTILSVLSVFFRAIFSKLSPKFPFHSFSCEFKE